MPIDPNIILGIKPAQIQQPDPLEQYGKSLTLKNLMLQNQQAEQSNQDETAQREALISSGGDNKRYRELLAGRGQYKAVQAIDKFNLENEGKRATIDKDKAETLTKAVAVHRDQLANIDNPQAAAQWVASGFNDPVLSPILSRGGDLQAALSRIPQDPMAFQQWKQQNALGATKFIEMNKPQVHTQDLGGTSQVIATPGLGGPPTVLSTTAKTQSPDSAAVDVRTAKEGALNRANHLMIAGLGPDGKPLNATTPGEKIDLAKIDKADLEAAYRYFADGTLPPNMGRGQQGMAESKRIRGISAQISESLGISPEEARANQLAFKGSGQAVTALVKREAQVGANVRNFDFNADQVLQLSQKVDRTGVPVVNAWINAGKRSVAGNPEIAAFDVAVKTTVNEFAQIVSGTTAGATTEGEKQKAEKLLSAAQTPAQITAVINQMRVESQNRMKSFADQKQATLGSLRAGGPKPATPAPAAQPAAPTQADVDAELRKRGVIK